MFLLSCLVTRGQTSFKNIAVVQNKTGFINGKLKDVQGVFRGKYSQWPSTREAVTIVLPASKCTSANTVASVVYNGTVKEMQKFWLSLVFQGRSNPPVFLETDAEIIAFVLKTPGAIGVVSDQSIKGIDNKYLFLFIE